VKTAALVGGPDGQQLLARWASDTRGPVQRALADAWRYFDPADYAKDVLQDAPLDRGRIAVMLFEHVPHLRILQHLRDARLDLSGAGVVDDLAFLGEAPSTTTSLRVRASGALDPTPLARFSALESLDLVNGECRRLEMLAALPALTSINFHLPDEAEDLSFLADCPSLTSLTLHSCGALTDLAPILAANALTQVCLWEATRLHDIQALSALPDLRILSLGRAPLAGGLPELAAVLVLQP